MNFPPPLLVTAHLLQSALCSILPFLRCARPSASEAVIQPPSLPPPATLVGACVAALALCVVLLCVNVRA